MIRAFSLGFLSAAAIVAMVPYFVRDELFFHSDPLSIALTLAALTFLLALPVGGVFIAAWLISGRSRKMLAILAAVPLGFLLAGFLTAMIEHYVIAIPGLEVLALTVIVLTVLIAAITVRLAPESDVLGRVQSLAMIVMVAGLALLAGGSAFSHARAASETNTEPKHLVFVVIDGFPAQLLNTYNPGEPVTAFDRIAARSTTFLNARSNKVYTNGYFGLIYSGDLSLPAGGYPRGTAHPPDLVARLQGAGVRTRVINFHANGLPQSNGMTGHKGLRSTLLTENYSWLPEMLGLEYDIFLAWPQTRGGFGARLNRLFEIMNPDFNEPHVWENTILNQVSALQRQQRSSFLIIHMSHTLHLVQRIASNPAVGSKLREFFQRATASDYRYGPQYEALMKGIRASYKQRADQWGGYLEKLIAVLEKPQSAKDTLLIVSADHGSVLSNGRIWYGYHRDEEVTRVPLLLYRAGETPATRSQNVDSRDIAKTIAAYFRTGNGFADGGQDLLSGTPAPKPVPVLTIESKSRKEWFLLSYDNDRVHVFNISRNGDASVTAGTVDGFDTGLEKVDLPPGDPAWSAFRSAVTGFGIKPDAIHPKLRAAGFPAS